MNTTTTSSDEDGCRDDDFVPAKSFRLGKNVQIDKSLSNSTTSATTVVVEVPPEKNKELKYGVISMIGRRRVMEDAVRAGVRVMSSNNEFVFFAAYDGHGASRVSDACCQRLHYILEEELFDATQKANDDNDNDNDSVDWKKVVMTCFSRMDDEVMVGSGVFEDVGRTVGLSAVVVIVGKEEVVAANCGDCRAILCSHGGAISLSNDHKPERPDERKRVEAAGGKILYWNGTSRVQGVLATSRSIGDHCLKPFVIPEPEVTVYKRNKLDEFLVIATNGLWDVVTNEVTCEVVRKCLDKQIQRFPERDSAADAAALLTEMAIAKGSKDNISVIVVELDKISDIEV